MKQARGGSRLREKLLVLVRAKANTAADRASPFCVGAMLPDVSVEAYCKRMASWGDSRDQRGGNLELELVRHFIYVSGNIVSLCELAVGGDYVVAHIAGEPTQVRKVIYVLWNGTH